MSIKVGIIADTHGWIRPEVLNALQDCDYILHAGDFAEEQVLDQIRFLANLYVVRGNSDFWWADFLAEKQCFRIGELNFVLVHNRLRAGPEAEDANVVVYGHTHHYSAEIVNGTLWLNPGSCGISRYGEELSFVLMEIENKNYTFERILLD